jgi:hypothetical protein
MDMKGDGPTPKVFLFMMVHSNKGEGKGNNSNVREARGWILGEKSPKRRERRENGV